MEVLTSVHRGADRLEEFLLPRIRSNPLSLRVYAASQAGINANPGEIDILLRVPIGKMRSPRNWRLERSIEGSHGELRLRHIFQFTCSCKLSYARTCDFASTTRLISLRDVSRLPLPTSSALKH